MSADSTQIRRANEADLDGLEALLGLYFRDEGIWETDRRDVLASYLRQQVLGFYVAVTDTGLVGCVLSKPLRQVPDAAECKRLYVLPSYRGRGLASQLMQAVEQGAAEAGLRWMYLDSKDEFRTALALYERRGYLVCDRFNDNAQATLFLRKRLA